MGVLTQDFWPHNKPTFEPIDHPSVDQNPAKKKIAQGPQITFVDEMTDIINQNPADRSLDKKTESALKKQLNFRKADLSNIMTEICLIAILTSAQSRNNSRDHLKKALERVSEEVTIKASLYNNRVVWTLTAVGGAASIISGAYGSFAMTRAGIHAASTVINGIQYEVGNWQAGGQLLEKVGGFISNNDRSKQEIAEHVIQKWNMLKDQDLQNSQSASAKQDEFLRTLQQINYSLHQIVSQVLGQSAGG
jgi:hypothetical protein